MNSNYFEIQIHETIAQVTINRPEKRNAFDIAMWLELDSIIKELEGRSDIGVIIITGAGSKAFASGADISEMGEDYPPVINGVRMTPASKVTSALENSSKVLIAMVNGYAIGGGCELAIACDLRIAAATAVFGISSAKLGICISPNNVRMLVNLVGPAKAKDILFTGRRLSAQEALSIGLVDYVVPQNELENFTFNYANAISKNAPLSIERSKKIINRIAQSMNLDKDDEMVAEYERCFDSRDFQEGVRAFLEKRKPNFKGH